MPKVSNTTTTQAMNAEQELLAKQYQKKTDREHILHAPDTYIGSIEQDKVLNWTYNETDNKMEYIDFDWIPGLYKCFDEGIVNARDHAIRMEQKVLNNEPNALPVKNIEINIDKSTGIITIVNDGNGIDVVEHPKEKIWIPELIFGHLRTSTNYNKDEKKIVGGKNGFGFKLVLIYSTWGKIETVDHIRGLKYTQEFKNNLSEICPPVITKCKTKPYTKVSWLPDYKRFGVDGLTPSMYALFQKRVFDISAVTDKQVKVKLNDGYVPIKTFEQYVDLYVGNKKETQRIYEKANERWEFAVCLTPVDEFTQVSFVNGIYTSKGGKHVDYILNKILSKLCKYIEEKKKVKVKPATIKEQLMLFVNCVVENPAFDSQTKDFMNTAVQKFGSSCDVSDKFVEKVAKLGIMEQAIQINQAKQIKEATKTDGKKTRVIHGIPKLDDANYAGTVRSHECTLILCEGDSAKAGVKSGLSSNDRNFMGIYPLKGKLMNVRDASLKSITDNSEISDLKKILGLETNKSYKQVEDVRKSLRYGKIMILTDADVDGHHIKGLVVNLFDSQWSNLIQVNDFLGFMNTPIVKATKGKQTVSFYNLQQYEDWKQEHQDGKGWTIKYYKGLGTSSAKEFKEYFAELNKHFVSFEYNDKSCSETLDMVFNKKRADDRKKWLENYNKHARLNIEEPRVSYKEFIDKELIHFSKYDNERSIPNINDGLKTSLRKILYAGFKRKLTKEIKVAQFAGYVSEHTAYHHGEKSLTEAIIGMAQEYVGSNNINLFMPSGQFGTRLQGGKDSASERYIFTYLNTLTKYLYPETDFPVLDYLDDDGTPVEPEFYVPIIPMILVNGSKGIGTGFSTDIMCYNPKQIIQYLKHRLTAKTANDMVDNGGIMIEPYYEGFKGTILKVDDTKYMFKGCYEVVKKDELRITELPIGVWTDSYKEFLEKLLDAGNNDTTATGRKKKTSGGLIKDYKDMSTDTIVNITVYFQNGKLDELLNKKIDDTMNALEKELNLTTTKTTTNMHLFDKEQRLHKYNTIYDIIHEYMDTRFELYEKRREYLLKEYQRTMMILSNKARFIEMQCDDTLDLRRKKKEQVVELLKSHKFDIVDDDTDYKYLRTMNIDSVIEENIEKLRKERDDAKELYDRMKEATPQTMWLGELYALEEKYEEYIQARILRQQGLDDGTNDDNDSENSGGKAVVTKKRVIRKKVGSTKTKK